MFDNILIKSGRRKGINMALFNFRKAVPVLALAVVITGALLTYNTLSGKYNKKLTSEYDAAGDAAYPAREDAAAPVVNQFQIGDRYYTLLSDDLRADFNLPDAVNES